MSHTEAREVATAAAAHSGVEIDEATSMEANTEISGLLANVWGVGPDDSPLKPALIRVASHLGCYVVAAYQPNGVMVGASFGMFAADGHLHSHITGVDPSRQGRGIGLALKLHQRVWALEHGIDRVSWTFDPLVARNAYFNIARLGVDVIDYHQDFYGEMQDEINAGDATDRLFVDWNLRSSRVEEAVAGTGVITEIDNLLTRVGVVVGIDGERPVFEQLSDEAGTVVVAVPPDIEGTRSRNPELAREWRMGVRAGLGDALRRGYRLTGVSRQGWYVLEKQ
ncbi:MAG: GNAT family N-acetyltransferase [Acidimicrobiia bacterium]|nr:GNAT family N-acetyltransferase [Acidimicrobiia bacterium]